ncbi:hypothetical protein [Chromobacterium amazonense]|uniref:hypothetical protein n=1 Tax=Chromobacterium amazonense TaxID=1382803 RepID=UPI0011B275D4|nr:hypothetical protein [Chromobacterium amazonense]
MNSFNAGKFASQHEFRGGVKIEIIGENIPVQYNMPTWYRLIENDCCLDVYAFIRHSDRMLILGQDALLEGRTELPYFYRSKWHVNFECSVITFNDPSLYDEKGRTCGWWQKPGAMELSHRFIRLITKKLAISENKLVFYGASAGGYYTLASASEFSQSIIIADIPQVDLETAPYQEKISYLKSFYGNIYDVFYWWGKERVNIREINYLQNKKDTKHIRTQLSAFLNGIHKISTTGEININNISIRLYENKAEARGHSPMEVDSLILLLREKIESL